MSQTFSTNLLGANLYPSVNQTNNYNSVAENNIPPLNTLAGNSGSANVVPLSSTGSLNAENQQDGNSNGLQNNFGGSQGFGL